MTHLTDASEALFRRSAESLVEGGSSPSRGPATYGAHPIFMREASGSRVVDVDGNEYVDWMMAYGCLPLGHAHPAVTAAVREAAGTGAHFATATEVELDVAERIRSLVPGVEKVRFANTGTESMMAVLRLVRGYTGRPRFIKFEGHYHGWYDDYLANAHPRPPASLGHRHDPVKVAESSGLGRHALDDTVVVPWNDLEAVERALANHPGRIAAVVTEGIMANMGVIPPEPGYLEGLRELTRAYDVLLVLDETVTGFRIGRGGCQARYRVEADLVSFGKGLGAGLPVAAFGGRGDIMEALAWGGVLHYGTQNGSRIGLHAARANLDALSAEGGAAVEHAWTIGESLRQGLQEALDEAGVPARVQGVGPMLQVLFTGADAIRDYRDYCAHVDAERYRRFALALFGRGVYTTPSAALHWMASAAHTMEDVGRTLEAVRAVLREGEFAG
ncbi:MAG: aspartate aminotransferase family protein [Candidatus Palauibacterales bacterium]|nr:aspartate aminotransferase family protein [Candidatus Palauibacterales bacterium]MDP2528764.1 aspartate aminotransferase family protein [Candidatus Palauibacterales bacterium]MDP2584314.1 aspartate aminotransferase family protein [Candidatus Palauibacterales bacterium]